MKRVTVVTPCFNEEENVRDLYLKVKEVFRELPMYEYEHLFIDNASTDGTVAILRQMAAEDHQVKVILNTRNFGHIRSPYHALLQSTGDATVLMACDFQDPPEMIPAFLKEWEKGCPIALGVKTSSEESALFYSLRAFYYKVLKRLSDVELTEQTTGFGVYDRQVIEALRKIDDPYPYFRGLIADLGYPMAKIEFCQPQRQRGITKNNFYTLYDMAMLGVTSHTKVPLRIAAIGGFVMSAISLLIALGYLVAKLVFWDQFTIGIAPLLIGIFFFSSVQLFFIGLLGEYIGAIHTRLLKRPLVVEKERINF